VQFTGLINREDIKQVGFSNKFTNSSLCV